MPAKPLSLTPPRSLRDKAAEAILALVLKIPASREAAIPQGTTPADSGPQVRSHVLSRAAARKASLLASSLALPPGMLGWITVLPELLGVWKLQSQMVADIAAVHGKSAQLTQEHLLYCLFKHVSAQLMRDVVVQAGERLLVRKASAAMLQNLAQKLGLVLSQKLLGKGLSRFVPLVGAVGVGAYAYFDTVQVARTAMALFAAETVVDASN